MSLGSLRFAAPPSYRPRRSGHTGHGRERPPVLECLDRHSTGWSCARPCHPPGGSLPSNQSPAGRLQSRLHKPVAMSEATEQRLRHRIINDLARIRNPARSLPKNHILWRRDTSVLKLPGSTGRRPALRQTGIESRAVAGNSWRGVPPPYLCGRAIPNVPVR